MGPSSEDVDVLQSIQDHADYIDSLLALLPPNIYFNQKANQTANNFQKHKKNKIKNQKHERKIQQQANKKIKLDPNKNKDSVPDILKQQSAHEQSQTKTNTNTHAKAPQLGVAELRQRLADKLLKLRDNRGGDASKRPLANSDHKAQKRKHLKSAQRPSIANHEATVQPGDESHGRVASSSSMDLNALKAGVVDASSRDDARARKINGQQTSGDNKSEPDDAGIDVWTKALEKAGGIKQKDDPKRARLALKRKERQKKKSAREWKSRVKAIHKEAAEKQNRRRQNLSDRATKGKNRAKMRKERAGFEGKKQSFLN